MNAYRLSGTVAQDLTITVRVPEASVGAEAEVIVLFPQVQTVDEGEHPLRKLLDDLRHRPITPGGAERSEDAQRFLRELRAEWD